ncbi:MAG TPA: glutaredoxin family protein [Candidatus Dormibacteraeota bacterium]|nr:glutaredoxin family protein [Candidatus Dormibacteraeota bacterium]
MGLQLIDRHHCHLCEEAAFYLRELGADFETVDVDGDPELVRAYGMRVPVLLREGEVLMEGRFDRTSLRTVLAT